MLNSSDAVQSSSTTITPILTKEQAIEKIDEIIKVADVFGNSEANADLQALRNMAANATNFSSFNGIGHLIF
jgi:hypothetical protein